MASTGQAARWSVAPGRESVEAIMIVCLERQLEQPHNLGSACGGPRHDHWLHQCHAHRV